MSEEIITIGARLRDERGRLGLSQTSLGEIVGASKRTVIDWEKGATSPTAAQLAVFASVGADALYILTGQRAGGISIQPPTSALSRRESALLDNYRNSPEDAKAALDKTSAAFAQPAQLGKSSARRIAR
ncbi:MAG: helix-turn-helix domain-containing protein [Pseudomonas sp.]|uniref:helix-turn-helix domain-containing protein n=1 Tax=Pseudomonas sp. TaxID=306 RepID=UPI003D6F3C3B